jgi:SAM-dependent methyltransferases related to tRNA (uracil-5-)-methyltransferase
VFNRGELITVKITGYAFGGNGVAKIPTENGEFVVFVNNTFPGQVAQARVEKKKKRYAEAKLIQVIERSPIEVVSEYQEISGAPYIYVPIEAQEKEKLDSTLEIYRKLGNFQDIKERFDTFISSPVHYFYRNKMEYSFSVLSMIWRQVKILMMHLP